MRLYPRGLKGFACLMLGAVAIAAPASAQTTNKSFNLGANLGTLAYTGSITGPACNVVRNVCNPAYPPSAPTYGEAIGLDVYQDNLYGTFLAPSCELLKQERSRRWGCRHLLNPGLAACVGRLWRSGLGGERRRLAGSSGLRSGL
jgi:hypothetical protein